MKERILLPFGVCSDKIITFASGQRATHCPSPDIVG